jgi:hypothetical protein
MKTTVLQMNVSFTLTKKKIPINFNQLTILVLNNDELNASGNGGNTSSSSNKLGIHIKSEDNVGERDPLAGCNIDGSFGQMNSQSGSNRPLISQNSPERIQPLPSNIVNKQSNSMDVS